jgi:hypothetical protein
MIYHLYLTVVLLTGQVQYDAVGPSGPNLVGCVKFAQYAITERVARGGVKSYTFQCQLRAVPK